MQTDTFVKWLRETSGIRCETSPDSDELPEKAMQDIWSSVYVASYFNPKQSHLKDPSRG